MHFALNAVNWFGSVVVLTLILNVVANLLTPKVKDWYATTSEKRAVTRVKDWEDHLAYIRKLHTNPFFFSERMFRTALKALYNILSGLVFVFLPDCFSPKLGVGVREFLSSVGVGWFWGAALVVRDSLRDLKESSELAQTEALVNERINILKSRFPHLQDLPATKP